MAKDIWIRAEIKGCSIASGRIELEFACRHYISTGETVHARALDLESLKTLLCFTKGIINSSQNALIQISDGWAPIGKLSTRFDLRSGVSVRKIVNDFSRDGDIDCVETKDDAEKLCLLSQRFAGLRLDLLAVAKANNLDVDRLSTRSLRALKNALDGRIERAALTADDVKLDANTKNLILQGR